MIIVDTLLNLEKTAAKEAEMDGAKVFLACALGAFIGGVFAVWFGFGLWVGVLVGSLAGYVAYDFGTVRRMAPIAARRAMEGGRTAAKQLKKFPLASALKSAVLNILLLALLLVSMGGLFVGFLSWVGLAMFTLLGAIAVSSQLYPVLLVASIFGFIGTLRYGYRLGRMTDERGSIVPADWIFLLKWNPATAPLVVAYTLTRNIVRNFSAILRTIGGIVAWPFQFCWHLFTLVHSDMRLLCATDAAIGTFVGWYLGNPVIGALVGGAFGWMNYELVSVRWLKLVPKPAKSQ